MVTETAPLKYQTSNLELVLVAKYPSWENHGIIVNS
jgi:hypothetical protein